ncbi:MAG: hypothetical protein KAU20_06020 [Nanoarchaeota archaeon]|nr:hypothetical protein [Nanoarchaeota archaeon]
MENNNTDKIIVKIIIFIFWFIVLSSFVAFCTILGGAFVGVLVAASLLFMLEDYWFC